MTAEEALATLNGVAKHVVFNEKNHTYMVDGIQHPSVSSLMKPLSDMVYGGSMTWEMADAMDRGKRAHHAIEMLDTIGLGTDEKDIAPYVDAYLKWRRDNSDVEPIAHEAVVVGDGYCGTIDKLMQNKWGQFFLLDIKTGEKAQRKLWKVQMEFYMDALRCMGLDVTGWVVVQCKKSGEYVEMRSSSWDTGMCDCLLSLHQYIRREQDEQERF